MKRKEMLINSANERKRKAHRTQRPKPIEAYQHDRPRSEYRAQQSDSLVQRIDQYFLNEDRIVIIKPRKSYTRAPSFTC